MKAAKKYYFSALCLIASIVSGCAGGGFEAGSDVAQGRQALFRGDYPTALARFQSAAQANPNYIFGTELREGVLSYLGRAQYLNGQLAPARATLQRAVAQHKSDNLARLYLGMTQAREGDRKTATANVDSGLKGMGEFVNYIINTFGNSFGSFWDQDGAVRKGIGSSRATITGGNFDWPPLISNLEVLAMKFEQLEDIATRNQRQFEEMNRP